MPEWKKCKGRDRDSELNLALSLFLSVTVCGVGQTQFYTGPTQTFRQGTKPLP